MSRRVFDVGLDIGRIKNGIHRRQEAKRTKSNGRSASGAEPNEDNQVAVVPKTPRKKSDSNVRSFAAHRENGTDDNGRVLSPFSDGGPATLAEDFPLPPSSPQDHHGSPEPRLSSPEGQKEGHNFDLNPPPPRKPVKMLDSLSERLFSEDHLRVILRDPNFFMRFTAFLNGYKPHYSSILMRYLEAQKAIKAIEYANALAESLKPIPGDESSKIPCAAATVDARFESRSRRSWETLVNEALPAYVTFCLVKVVTESMVREITGTTMPLMRELVGGLAEVFCLADPSQQDTPIVYASEEFYRTTQYGRDYVIGKNCRFLQGPMTNKRTVTRLSTAIKGGQEASETILNYRRGGEPFMNLFMTAPLYDNRGKVRYIIGAQVDVSGLVEDGRGLDSFERTLNGRTNQRDSAESDKKHLRRLGEFGEMLSQDETSALGGSIHSRTSSLHETESARGSVRGGYSGAKNQREPGRRRMLGNEDEETEGGREWALSSSGPSGKLPGVYQNYFLVRPFPSLRIIFVSPALRIPGLLQTHFLSRIGGPSHVREGLSEAFESGESVTAKVTWLPQGRSDDGDYARPGSSSGARGASDSGKTRYISCTPLLGSDDQVGVWMVVMVENERVTGTLPSRLRPQAERLGAEKAGEIPNTPSEYEREANGVHNFVREQNSTRNFASAARDRPQREPTVNGNGPEPTVNGNRNPSRYDSPKSQTQREPIINGNDNPSRYDSPRSQPPTSPPPQVTSEAFGKAYEDFMRGQQRTNGDTPNPAQTRSPYGHRIHEDYRYQTPQRGQQPTGPGKVMSLDSEGEEEGMMGRGRRDGNGNGMEAFMDGEGSPRMRNGVGERE